MFKGVITALSQMAGISHGTKLPIVISFYFPSGSNSDRRAVRGMAPIMPITVDLDFDGQE